MTKVILNFDLILSCLVGCSFPWFLSHSLDVRKVWWLWLTWNGVLMHVGGW